MAGIYFISGSMMSRFTDSPLTNPGRALFISGHFGGDERLALLIPSNDSHIYFGHRYGGTDYSYKWEMK